MKSINTGLGEVDTAESILSLYPNATYQAAFGLINYPGAWRPVDQIEPVGTSRVRITLLIGAGYYNPESGVYYLWHRIVIPDSDVEPVVDVDKYRKYKIISTSNASIGDAHQYATRGEFEEADAEVLAAAKAYTDQRLLVLDGGNPFNTTGA